VPLHVTLLRDMKPWRAGDSPALPDDLAQKLIEAGEAKDPRPYSGSAPAQHLSEKQVEKLLRPKRYLTRKRG